MIITSIEELEKIYSVKPALASMTKVVDHLTPEYRKLIEASPFVALATIGESGLDCSPRGDRGSVVVIADDQTLLLPDRRGNNRIDSLRNVVTDPRVALLFLIPGSGTTLRVNGHAEISVDAELLGDLAVEGKAPRSVLVIHIDAVYFQCARAVKRAGLWEGRAEPADLPSVGTVLEILSKGEIKAEEYDTEWPERAAKTMW
jgi:uncharacterized protein